MVNCTILFEFGRGYTIFSSLLSPLETLEKELIGAHLPLMVLQLNLIVTLSDNIYLILVMLMNMDLKDHRILTMKRTKSSCLNT